MMKHIIFTLLILSGFVIPWACTNKVPTGPLATFNLTATFTDTVTLTPTNWAGYTSSPTPSGPTNTQTSTMTSTMTQTSTVTLIHTATYTVTQTLTNTQTQTCTATITQTFLPTPVLTNVAWQTTQAPNGVAYDGTNVYVAEGAEGTTGGLIQIFNPGTGQATGQMTTYDGTDTFGQPNGAAYLSSNLYVVDQLNAQVYKFIPPNPVSATVATSWSHPAGASVTAPTAFSGPEGICADTANSLIYVADTGNNYVEVFNGSLVIQAEVGDVSNCNCSFNNPSAVAVNAAGTTVVVADAATAASNNNNRIQVFSYNGSSYTSVTSFTVGTSSSDVYGLLVDSGNDIYVADVGLGMVEEYTSTGTLETQGLGISPLNSPSPDGLVLIGSNLLVSDYANNQLYLVTP
jgi:hypothetical protein